MIEQHAIYLTPRQVRTIRSLGLFDGDHSIQIIQGDLLTAGEYSGHLMVRESLGTEVTHIDRDGNIVPKKA